MFLFKHYTYEETTNNEPPNVVVLFLTK